MPSTPSARRKARKFIVQALYQWELTGNALNEIDAQFRTENDMEKVDTEYFSKLLHGVPSKRSELEAEMAPFLDRTVAELDPVSLSILRMGIYELTHCIDVPYKVVINESVNLAKTFGATDSFKYINGVLDKAARKHRSTEIKAG